MWSAESGASSRPAGETVPDSWPGLRDRMPGSLLTLLLPALALGLCPLAVVIIGVALVLRRVDFAVLVTLPHALPAGVSGCGGRLLWSWSWELPGRSGGRRGGARRGCVTACGSLPSTPARPPSRRFRAMEFGWHMLRTAPMAPTWTFGSSAWPAATRSASPETRRPTLPPTSRRTALASYFDRTGVAAASTWLPYPAAASRSWFRAAGCLASRRRRVRKPGRC